MNPSKNDGRSLNEDDLRPPTVVEFDIIRQIDEDEPEARLIINCSTLVVYCSLLFVIITFLYFTLATRGREDPYIWNFLSTMQLLTHILLINVKIPGNAALFFNLVMPPFRFDFIPQAEDWV